MKRKLILPLCIATALVASAVVISRLVGPPHDPRGTGGPLPVAPKEIADAAPADTATGGTAGGRPADTAPSGTGAPVLPAGPAGGGAESGTLFVEGRALEEETGQPLSRAEIRVRIENGDRSETRVVTTDAQGAFRIVGMPVGESTVTFEHVGFLRVGREVHVVPGSPARELEVSFRPGLTVRGIVRNLSGGEGCPLSLEWRSHENPRDVFAVTTDGTGAYEASGLSPGRYAVRLAPAALRAAWTRETTVEVEVSADDAGAPLDLELELGRSLVVRVVDAGGRPRGAAQVRLELKSDGRGVSTFLSPTDAEGKTVCCGLPESGTAVLEVPAGEGGSGRVEVDLEAVPEELLLVLAPARVLEGHALDGASRGLAGARVRAAQDGGGVKQTATADAEGRFRLLDLAPGRWLLLATAAADGVGTIQEVEVAEGRATAPVRIVLTGQGAIGGRVMEEDGSPAAGARVKLSGAGHGDEAVTGADGSFLFPAKEDVEYRIAAEGRGGGTATLEAARGGSVLELMLERAAAGAR